MAGRDRSPLPEQSGGAAIVIDFLTEPIACRLGETLHNESTDSSQNTVFQG